MPLVKHSDGTVQTDSGRIVLFSLNRFLHDICEGSCCFICGAHPSDRQFNDEHILPKWILREFDLFDQSITLPNDTLHTYRGYTIPCCESCNTMMGREIEEPVRALLHSSWDEFAQELQGLKYYTLIRWLNLILLKTHLKTTQLRLNRDHRASDAPLSSVLDLTTLHHIHCVARSFYSGCVIDQSACPQLITIRMADRFSDQFDYSDLSYARTIMIQFRDRCMICVLDDSGMATAATEPFMRHVRAGITPLQAREIVSRIAFGSLLLTRRPQGWTKLDPTTGDLTIGANVPESIQLEEIDDESFGSLFYRLAAPILGKMANGNLDEIREGVRSGRTTFLYDEDGNFNERSMVVPPTNADSTDRE